MKKCINCNKPIRVWKRQLNQNKWKCPKCGFWNRKEILPICPRCGSNRVGRHSSVITKRGWIVNRYICYGCHRVFNFNGVINTNRKCFIIHNPEIVEEALSLTKDLSDPKVAEHLNKKYGLNIHRSSIMKWRWKFLLKKEILRYPSQHLQGLNYFSKKFLKAREIALPLYSMESDLYRLR